MLSTFLQPYFFDLKPSLVCTGLCVASSRKLNSNFFLFSEFASMIKQLVGKSSTVKQVAAVEDDPQRRKPDISRAKKYLGWEPKVCHMIV